ncbi:MAG: RluA family pseudouridine synthase [Desulfohalobiaceae bacterium]|nr:RluA family pseudouridine synthase [Desulfohalobiaceae bacterium]
MRWIRTGQVRVDRSRSKPFARVHEGQLIRIPPYRPEDRDFKPAAEQVNPFVLSTVYEDANLLVLAKPPNLATQPGSRQTDSVHDRLLNRYSDSSWMPSLVHRLDKETSGLLLVAKSYEYLQHLQGLWQTGKVKKEYLAWVQGRGPGKDWVRFEDSFPVESKGYYSRKIVKAESIIRTLEEKEGNSLVIVRLLTGRKHQIRIQTANRGLPVVGDGKYGKGGSGQGLLLHAFRLSFDEFVFVLPPPWEGVFQVPAKWLEEI